MKRHAPATLRNRDAIAAVLAEELPEKGTVLEIAAGSGEHAVYFAGRFPALQWLPSDPDTEALASIAEYRREYAGKNCLEPIQLDASASEWPIPDSVSEIGAIACINMIHISPWEAAIGLFEGAANLLGEGAPLILYGPYFEQGVEPAPSNIDFDLSLRARDSRWGIRQAEHIDKMAVQNGFARTARRAMPANNLILIYRKVILA